MPSARSYSTLLFGIKSPLQAINAVEYTRIARSTAETSPVFLVFCPFRRPQIREAIHRILRHEPDARIIDLPTIPSGKALWKCVHEIVRARIFSGSLRRTLATLPPPDKLVLGDYRSRECRDLAARLPGVPVVLLDDGSATHQIAKYRTNPDSPDISPLFPENDWRGRRLGFYAGIRGDRISAATFFTHYDIRPAPGDTVVRHDYPYWRSQIRPKHAVDRDDVWFLGMSHVEKELTGLDTYLATIKRILSHYPGRTVRYRPHRDESPDKIAQVTTLGFSLLPSANPVEIDLLEADRLPSEIASIASSALDNLAVMFGERIKLRCYLPTPDYCAPSLRAHFEDIIGYHRLHLETVDLSAPI